MMPASQPPWALLSDQKVMNYGSSAGTSEKPARLRISAMQTIATARASALTGTLDNPAFGRTLPNRSGRCGLSKLLQPEQHGQRPLQLTIQVRFIPCRHIEILRSIGNPKCLISDGVTMLQLDDRLVVPFPTVMINPSLERSARSCIRETIIRWIR